MTTQQQPKKSKGKKILGWIIIVIAAFIIIGIVSDDKDKIEQTAAAAPTKVKEPELTISSVKLYQDYTANEIDADNAYKGKYIQVNGKVTNIAKDITNEPYVTLTGSSEEFEIGAVQCMLKDETAAAGLQKGDIVSIRGKCDGKMMNVIIRNCELEKLSK